MEGLKEWASHYGPATKKVFVVHGEDEVTDSFACMTIGSVNGQALKAALDLSASLLATEGDRRKLRIDLGMPVEDEVDQAALIAAEQRKTVGKVVPMRKTKKSS